MSLRVKNRCTLPIKSFSFAVEFVHVNNKAMVSADAGSGVLMSDRGDLPLGFMPTGASRPGSGQVGHVKLSAKTVNAWCSSCTRTLGPQDFRPDPLGDNGLAQFDNVSGLEVSAINSKLRSHLAVNTMSGP
jgi:hypothetical protein